jgi:hypothetical protein
MISHTLPTIWRHIHQHHHAQSANHYRAGPSGGAEGFDGEVVVDACGCLGGAGAAAGGGVALTLGIPRMSVVCCSIEGSDSFGVWDIAKQQHRWTGF